MTVEFEQVWTPQGIFNFRDLGGLPVVGGGSVRAGKLFRSATPQQLTAEDLDWLVNRVGLRSVLDLRFPKESESEGHGLLTDSGVEIIKLPFRVPLPEENAAAAVPEHNAQTLGPFYVAMAELSMESVAAGVRLLVNDGVPALFHCAAGKDRTGIFAALVLSTIGVPDEAIVTDYVRTNDGRHQMLAQLRSSPYYADREHLHDPDSPRNVVVGEVIQSLLDGIRERFGSTRGYLVAAGLSEDELDELRAILVEE